jgi:hypothetical protein
VVGPDERIEKARALLLSALDDLDAASERGDALEDFVMLMVTEHVGDEEATHTTTGISVSVSRRLGTLAYFSELARHRLWEDE